MYDQCLTLTSAGLSRQTEVLDLSLFTFLLKQPNTLLSSIKKKKDYGPILWKDMETSGHEILLQFPVKLTSADMGPDLQFRGGSVFILVTRHPSTCVDSLVPPLDLASYSFLHPIS